MEQRLSLVTLATTDLARSRRFYEEGLGWSAGFSNDEVVFYQANGIVVGLFTGLAADLGVAQEAMRGSGIALAFNARSRVEVDATMAEAEAAGAVVAKAPEETPWGGYSGYFTDPDGHAWEVAHNPGWTLDAAGNVRMD